jgi:transaldolase
VKFFLDTGDVGTLRDLSAWGAFSGVTVNPVILARESTEYERTAHGILEVLHPDWELSLPVRSGTADEMIAQARTLADWDDRVRVKVPATGEGLRAAAALAQDVRLNMTVVKSAAQGLMCQALANQLDARDMIISVFCGRLRQAGVDWHAALSSLTQTMWPGEVLAASIKTPSDIEEAAALGADIVTAPPDVYELTMKSVLVDEDVKTFDDAFDVQGLAVPGTEA